MEVDVSSFIDPDNIESKSTYKWDEDFQREIIGLMLVNRPFLIENMSIIKPNYFSNETHERICRILFQFFDKYKTSPTRSQIVQLLRDDIQDKSDEVKAGVVGEFNIIISEFTNSVESRDHYRDKISNFAKTQAMKMAIHQTLEMIKKDPESEKTWDGIREIMTKACSVEHNFELGLNYFTSYEDRYNRKIENGTGDVFTSGFKAIDDALQNGGLSRGEIGSWIGLSGSGKSLALVAASLANLNLGKKVLYISLELDQDLVAARFDSQIANLVISQNNIEVADKGVTINNLVEKKDIVFSAIEDYGENIGINEETRFVIKQFPSGAMGMSDLRAYHQQILLRGFNPDLIIVDYIGEMRDYEGMDTHESRYRIVRDLRGFAIENKVCVLTAMQPNRSGKEAVKLGNLLDDENLGDSYAQIKPLDAMWSLNQLSDEKHAGLARGYIAKHRAGRSKETFYISMNKDTLSMHQISEHVYEERLKKYRNEKEITVSDVLKSNAEINQLNEIFKKKREAKAVEINFHSDAGYDSGE